MSTSTLLWFISTENKTYKWLFGLHTLEVSLFFCASLFNNIVIKHLNSLSSSRCDRDASRQVVNDTADAAVALREGSM